MKMGDIAATDVLSTATWTMMSYMVMTVMVRVARKITIAAWALDVSTVSLPHPLRIEASRGSFLTYLI